LTTAALEALVHVFHHRRGLVDVDEVGSVARAVLVVPLHLVTPDTPSSFGWLVFLPESFGWLSFRNLVHPC
jgi:hypothetical protein